MIRFRETQGVPVTAALFWAFDGQKFVEETGQVAHFWIPPQGFHPVGSLPQAATIDNVTITNTGATFILNTEDLTGAARAPMTLTFDASNNSVEVPGLFENWSPSNWRVKGRYQYYVTTFGGVPLERFNVVDDQAYGDGGNGIVFLNESGASPQLELAWASGVTYAFTGAWLVVAFVRVTPTDWRDLVPTPRDARDAWKAAWNLMGGPWRT